MKINKRILKSIQTLPPFPATIQKVMALASNPDSSLTELVAVVRLDQAITANILRICNSAYFGLRRPVDNVNDAIMYMGKKNVLRAVMTAGLSRYFRTQKGYDVKGGDLWEHAVGVALMAQICAAKLSRPDDPRLFTAAILHDIGKMVLGEFVHESWQKIQELVEKQRYSFLEAEEEVIGVNHAELGGEIALNLEIPRRDPPGDRIPSPSRPAGRRRCRALDRLPGQPGLPYHGHRRRDRCAELPRRRGRRRAAAISSSGISRT